MPGGQRAHWATTTRAGYTRYKVRNQVFPAIVPAPKDSKVEGKVLLELTDHELHVLDGEQGMRQTFRK